MRNIVSYNLAALALVGLDRYHQNSILDEISAEVAALTDDEILAAASQIQARIDRQKANVTPETKQKMKDREKRRRLLNAAIMKLAKEKGLVGQAQAQQTAQEASTR